MTAPADHDDMIAEVESTVAWIDEKLENGRIRDPERARARQGYLRLKIQAIGEWRKLTEARELEDLRDELGALKERQQLIA